MLASGLAIAPLGMNGCTEEVTGTIPASKRIRTAETSVRIGTPADYMKDQVYLDHYKENGLFIVNNRGMLVALSAENPNSDHTVRYDPTIDQYVDPSNGSRFTADGLPTGPPRDRLALERCRIALGLSIDDGPKHLFVDPETRFLFEEVEWSHFNGYFDLRRYEDKP